MDQQVLEVSFNTINSELEVLILWVGKDVVQQTSEGNDQFSNETTD